MEQAVSKAMIVRSKCFVLPEEKDTVCIESYEVGVAYPLLGVG